ncbi:BNR/Asp-box repeat family protein isoform 1 [Hibiscus syriacus]|uniref:BNR/Asp-box repeat family protein isoform 1 n=1 Tax=Hibiscus syriacus TaxID=106335 RepID=A0A6A3BGU5_HIBSY|nr:BNR/Asp-box repeat family protein isoform 1 [Hibiscus syriacus]
MYQIPPQFFHPLQCRALELCFSVALERLPAAQSSNSGGSPGLDPPISNALMAALKRAQAHQRRGCPEQQQQRFWLLSSTTSNSANTAGPIGLGFRPVVAPVPPLPRLPSIETCILVGDSEPEAIVKEILRKIESKEMDGVLRNVEVELGTKVGAMIGNLDCGGVIQMVAKIKELGTKVWSNDWKLGLRRVILDLGDLKWLVENNQAVGLADGVQQQQQAVSVAGRAAVVEMGKLLGRFKEGSARVWLIGTATCETYLRCQVYHLQWNDWDLQAVPIAAKAPHQECFPGLGAMGYLAALLTKEFEQRSSDTRSNSNCPALPQWLQNAKAHDSDAKTVDQTQTKDQEVIWTQKTQELQKNGMIHACISIQIFISPVGSEICSCCSLNDDIPTMERTSSPPGSPVKTDLVLGRPKILETTPERTNKECLRDFLGCIPSEPQNKLQDLQSNKLLNTLDVESFKKLLKGLIEKVWWQRDAASAVATTGWQEEDGIGPLRSSMWGSSIVVCLGSRRDDGESNASFRGKTVVDKIAEAVRRNPFSVVMLEDFEEADMLVRGSIKRAMERGRLTDSHGREISLGNVIFILAANWMPGPGYPLVRKLQSAEPVGSMRRTEQLSQGRNIVLYCLILMRLLMRRMIKQRMDHTIPVISTVDHDEELGLTNRLLSNSTSSSVSHELLNFVDEAIIFKPVDFGPIRRNISSLITKKFCSIIGNRVTIEIVDEALNKITSGVWIGRIGLEEWTEKALVPSLRQLKTRLPTSEESLVVRLELIPNPVIEAMEIGFPVV